jgi:hypothetical protein
MRLTATPPVSLGVRRQKRPHQCDRLLVPLYELSLVSAVPPAINGIVIIRNLVYSQVHQRVGNAGPIVSIKASNNALHFILRSLLLTSET